MLSGEDGGSEVAIIEFNSRDEALVAQTRDQKLMDEHVIEVQFTTEATLFVTNFPATADEAYIRRLFQAVRDHLPNPLNPLEYARWTRLTLVSMVKFSTSGFPRSSTTRIADFATCSSRIPAPPTGPWK